MEGAWSKHERRALLWYETRVTLVFSCLFGKENGLMNEDRVEHEKTLYRFVTT